MTETDETARSTQGYLADKRNENVLVYLNGDLVRKQDAQVSIFDSGFVLGDGVWEGLRLVHGRIIALDRHIERLYQGALALQIDIGLDRVALVGAIRETLAANKMQDGVHIRVMISRGRKSTPNQDPRFVISQATIVIVAEYKTPRPDIRKNGISLFTSAFRCSTPDVFDLHLNTHSRLNFIQALLQAINAGADEALMLDPHGFVASCNSTNFFIVRGGELWTSSGRFSFKGITRASIIEVCRGAGMQVTEKDFTLAEVYTADEAFVTGTLGGVTPVTRIDGRPVGDGKPGIMTAKTAELYEMGLQ